MNMPEQHIFPGTLDEFEEAVMAQLWFDPFNWKEDTDAEVIGMITFDYDNGRTVERSAERINNLFIGGIK